MRTPPTKTTPRNVLDAKAFLREAERMRREKRTTRALEILGGTIGAALLFLAAGFLLAMVVSMLRDGQFGVLAMSTYAAVLYAAVSILGHSTRAPK